MTGPFCLLKNQADELADALEHNKFAKSPLLMDSAERHAAFGKIVGEANASRVNAAFESKLLLQNRQQGINNYIASLKGLKPEVRRDMIARVERMDKVLNPAHMQDFLADLAKQKLGFDVTMQEAGQVSQLAKDVATTRAAAQVSGADADFAAYLDARRAFREGVADLSPRQLTIPEAMAAYVRAGALSWPTTLVKLTAVAASRMVTTPLTDATAVMVSNAFPKLAKMAPRYGTRSPTVAMKAEAAAQAAMWVDGMIDAGRMLKNKGSRLDVAFGKSEHIGHAWYEYSGSLHGALKEPIKRAEFARSLYRRTADALARGEDVKDLTVRMRLHTEAFDDATAAISMQDNIISSSWNAGLRRLGQVDPKTGKPNPLGTFIATSLRMDTPVMKAPTNNILEASEWIGGLPLGAGRAAWAYAKGLEGLKPVQADAIIRQISRGSIGAALMTLYYFKHDLIQFGGFYRAGEKRKEGDVKEGAARVGDVTIPKQVLHNPMFDALQFSASMARVTEHPHGANDGGLASASSAAVFGLLDELPVLHTAADAKRIISEQGGLEYLDKKLAGEAVPGVVQWIAKATDSEEKRKPKGLAQNLEANIPGLRQNVPTTQPKKRHY